MKKINPDSEVLVLAFGGMMSGLGMPPFEFMKTFSDKSYSCVFFKDFHQFWYQKGLLGFTNDVYGTRDFIQSIIADVNPRYVITLGTSSGGYAAIMFGILLGVNRILAFSPQTKIGQKEYEAFASLDTPDFQDADQGEKNIWNLSKLIDEQLNSDTLPDIHIYYGALNRRDKIQAEYLKKFQNVTLYPVEGQESHGISAVLKKQKKLDIILESACKFN